MFLSCAVLALAAHLAPPLDLDAIDLQRARALSGRLVVASFIVAKPLDAYPRLTSVGAADRDDGAERGAILRGRRLDVKEGQRLNVVGRFRVIDHKAAVVGTVFVPAWVEVRVSE